MEWLQLERETALVGIRSALTVLHCWPGLMIFLLHLHLHPTSTTETVSLSLYKLPSVSAVKKAICEKLHSGPVPRPSTSVQTLFLTLKKASVSVLLKCPMCCVSLSCVAAKLSFSFLLNE